MSTLLFADIANGQLGSSTAKALTAARALGAPVTVLVVGQNVSGIAQTAARLEGVSKVVVADAAHYANQLAEPTAALIVSLVGQFSSIVSGATSNAKNILPRVAALLDVMQVSEIVKVISPDTFDRPIYAGNAIQTVQATDAIKVITVRTAAFTATGEGSSVAPIEMLAIGPESALSEFKGEAVAKSDRPELTAAKIIISGGRALQNSENFKTYIEPVADKLGAAMGASRAAVDAGYAPNDWQVGQTGKVVAPDLYIAAGISGAIQHLAGM